MSRITNERWRNLDPWEMCGQDYYCKRECHDDGGCTNGCIVPKLYIELAKREDAEGGRTMMNTEWLIKAIETIKAGIADKLTKDNITVYRVKNIIRIDIKVEE